MLKIAICDDDKNICWDLENKLKKIAIENDCINDYIFNIKSFCSTDDLYKYFHENEDAFDVIFLDIKFDENSMAGIRMGNTIRKQFFNETIKIVYISSYKDYAMDLFETHPFDFLLKPISYEKVNEIINSILRIIHKQNEPFIYKVEGVEKKIDLFKILYFVNHRRKIEIITLKKSLEYNAFYGKISDVGKWLAKADFFFIHQSYLINYHNVANFEYTYLELINGDKLEISQRYRKSIREMRVNKLENK